VKEKEEDQRRSERRKRRVYSHQTSIECQLVSARGAGAGAELAW
jgi:hypothetical protein